VIESFIGEVLERQSAACSRRLPGAAAQKNPLVRRLSDQGRRELLFSVPMAKRCSRKLALLAAEDKTEEAQTRERAEGNGAWFGNGSSRDRETIDSETSVIAGIISILPTQEE
jgi:hypothetical protein